jgi:hypothetical protein
VADTEMGRFWGCVRLGGDPTPMLGKVSRVHKVVELFRLKIISNLAKAAPHDFGLPVIQMVSSPGARRPQKAVVGCFFSG